MSNFNKGYEVKCLDNLKWLIWIGGFFIVVIISSLVFGNPNYSNTLFWLGMIFFFLIILSITYGILTRNDKVNKIITLSHKRVVETDGEGGPYFSYYFDTINGEFYGVCSKLYDYLKGDETIEMDEAGHHIVGLVNILDRKNEYHNNDTHNIDERSNESKRTGSPFK